MSRKFISTRPGGFKITLGGKQQVFPMNEICEVPDSISVLLQQYVGFVGPYVEKSHVEYVPDPDAPVKSDDRENGKGETDKETNDDGGADADKSGNDLASLGLTDAVIKALTDEGLGTKAKVSEAIDAGRILAEIPGIGKKTENRIIEALTN